MQLEPYTNGDLWLTRTIETDPEMMANLGGPIPADDIARIHARRLDFVARGGWYFKIVDDVGAAVLGTICLWRSEHDGEEISEVGWAILREHQGQGHATAALRMLIERAREDGRWGALHAFTAVKNAPSNALCRRFGFANIGEVDIDYADRPLHCNHWVLDAWRQASGPNSAVHSRTASASPGSGKNPDNS